MMKLVTAALLLVSFLFLAHGGEAFYHAARNRQPVAIACGEFVRQRPRGLWLRVSGCDVDYVGAGYRESRGRLAELFLPMRAPLQPAGSRVALVVATTDPQVLAIASATIGSSQQPDQEAYVGMMRRIVTMLNASKQVEGYARSGFVERFGTRRALAGLTAPLEPDFVALDLHAKPSFVRPVLELGMGLGLLLVAVAWRRRTAPAVHDEALASAASAPGDLVATPRRIPSAMLLNLGPSAGAGDLEAAPPLGNREEVRERLAALLGAADTTQDGRAMVRGEDWSLALDLGREEPVWTITVEARGDGSTGALEQLARETGWRIYIPKLGTFVDPRALTDLTPP
jgi:hypothetical protein